MGAGKSTVADMLVRRHGYVRLAFADQLRAMLEPSYGKIDKASIYATFNGIISGRQLLQQSGAALRTVDEAILLRAIARRIAELGPKMPIVIDDVRLPVEAEFVKDLGFTVVLLECDEETRKRRAGATWSEIPDVTEEVEISALTVNTAHLDPNGVVGLIDAISNEAERYPVWQECRPSARAPVSRRNSRRPPATSAPR
jgi:adenylate kinase family enzyme